MSLFTGHFAPEISSNHFKAFFLLQVEYMVHTDILLRRAVKDKKATWTLNEDATDYFKETRAILCQCWFSHRLPDIVAKRSDQGFECQPEANIVVTWSSLLWWTSDLIATQSTTESCINLSCFRIDNITALLEVSVPEMATSAPEKVLKAKWKCLSPFCSGLYYFWTTVIFILLQLFLF